MIALIGKGIDMLKRRIAIILASMGMLLLASGCFLAKPASLDLEPPPGSAEYRQGWSDGCESGLSAYGTPFYKTFHRVKQDPILAQNKVYYQVWKDAYAYCAVYVMTQATHGVGNRDFQY